MKALIIALVIGVASVASAQIQNGIQIEDMVTFRKVMAQKELVKKQLADIERDKAIKTVKEAIKQAQIPPKDAIKEKPYERKDLKKMEAPRIKALDNKKATDNNRTMLNSKRFGRHK